MSHDNQIDLARAIATVAHRGQVDKAGEPYIGHAARVAAAIPKSDDSRYPLTVAAAWLHDVIEDTDLTAGDLHDAGMNWSVISIVEKLTRTQDETPAAYYERIRDDWEARTVKQADIADNTDPNRLAMLPPETQTRLITKYARARFALGLSTIDPDRNPTTDGDPE